MTSLNPVGTSTTATTVATTTQGIYAKDKALYVKDKVLTITGNLFLNGLGCLLFTSYNYCIILCFSAGANVVPKLQLILLVPTLLLLSSLLIGSSIHCHYSHTLITGILVSPHLRMHLPAGGSFLLKLITKIP